MVTVDFRTRYQNDQVSLDVDTFVDAHLPALLAANGVAAGRAAARLALTSLTLDVDGTPLTFAVDGDRVVVRRDTNDSLVVALNQLAFSDLVQDVASTFGVQMTGRARVLKGTVDDFVVWEPVLRCLLDGRPAYEPGTIAFHDRDGKPLDLHRSFTVDDDPAEIGHFLAEAGYLHLEGVFTEAEMAAVSAELDDAIAAARQDDGASWWAKTSEGEWYASRILGFNQKSPALRDCMRSERFRRIMTFTDDSWVQRNPDVGDSAEGLLKKVGVVEGISDVSWHKDCSMGGHSRGCCGLTTGISITGAGKENGELGVIAGSHRANIAPLGIEGLDLPAIALPTRTGDVTVHCSCTLHMSRPPVSAERRVSYTGFGLAPRPGDRAVERTPEEIRADRASLNDHVRRQQHERALGERVGSFQL
jgi:Phytanoyl-CoA dioxygenase (PhyH)